jgi:hypothetical protein
MSLPVYRQFVRITDPPTAILPEQARVRLEATGAFDPLPLSSPAIVYEQLEQGLNCDVTPSEEQLEGKRRASKSSTLDRISKIAEAEVGAVLAGLGFLALEYEPKLAGKTPDWWHRAEPAFFLDVYARVPGYNVARWLVDEETSDFFPAVRESDLRQVWDTIDGKARRYRNVAEELHIPFIIAIRSLLMTTVDESLLSLRHSEDFGSLVEFFLSKDYPFLSAIMLLNSAADGDTEVVTWSNPDATYLCPLELLGGP